MIEEPILTHESTAIAMLDSLPDLYVSADDTNLIIQEFDHEISGAKFALYAEADIEVDIGNDFDPGDGFWTAPSGGNFIKEIEIEWTEIVLLDDEGERMPGNLIKSMSPEQLEAFTDKVKNDIILDEA